MDITKLVLGECITNVYIVASEKKNAILIDPADDAKTIIDTIENKGLKLKYIFITHGHTDHILALKEVMVNDFKGDFRVLTGHRQETTLEHERQFNPYVKRN